MYSLLLSSSAGCPAAHPWLRAGLRELCTREQINQWSWRTGLLQAGRGMWSSRMGRDQESPSSKPSLPTLGSHHNSPSGPAQLRTFSRNSEELPEGLTPNHPPPLVPSMFAEALTEKEEWLLPHIRVPKLHNRALMQKRLLMFVLSFDALLLIPHFLVRKYFFMVGKCGWETNT